MQTHPEEPWQDNPAATYQPPPRLGTQEVTPLVIADLQARRAFGLRKYGTPLMVENGRDHLMDAYQEILDHSVYMRCELEKRALLKERLKAAINTLYAFNDVDIDPVADELADILGAW